MSKTNTSVEALNISKLNLVMFTGHSKTIITVLESNGISLGDVLKMESIATLANIKGIGDKAMGVLRLFRLMNKRAQQTVLSSDIDGIRVLFSTQETIDFLTNPKTFKWFRAIHKEFLKNPVLDAQIANAFSMFAGEDLLSKRIGEVFNAIPKYAYIGELSEHNMVLAYQSLAATIFNGLVETGVITEHDEVKPYIGINGKRYYRTEKNVVFPGDQHREADPMKGAHNEPGKVIAKKVKVKPGGIAYKFNKAIKDYLRTVASQALELVEITEEEFYAFAKAEKWYTTDSANFDRILKNKMIDDMYALYLSMLGKTYYLSMWFDYRYRGYYDFNNFLFGPHSKAGKYMWQAADAKVQSSAGQELHIESAVTIALGKRHNVAEAAAVWATSEEEIVTTLLDPTDKHFGEALYQRRLVQAIADTEEGKAIKFLLAGDNTNGGLQIFSAEFKSVKSRSMCNIGGLESPQDSHQPTATAFGIDRDIAKKSVNQAVLHGGAYKTMADTLLKVAEKEITPTQARDFLIEAFGPEIVNIVEFQDFCRSLYDNYNSTLKFSTIDGWPAQSIAFIEHLEHKVYGLSSTNKAGYSSTTVSSNMPLVLTNTKAEVVYSDDTKDTRQAGEKRKANTRMSGSFANVTHAVDGWSMRQIIMLLVQHDYAGINVHDMYLYQADAHALYIRPQYRRNLLRIEEYQPFTTAAKQMNDNRIGTKMPLPQFIYGDSPTSAIENSNCMIAA